MQTRQKIIFTEYDHHRARWLKCLLIGITLCFMPAAHSSDTINLPAPRLDSDYSIERAIEHRRSIRNYNDESLLLSEASQLLWSAQGLTDDEGLRAAPSAGALYPLELYLVAGNVQDLKPGIYRYLPEAHQLHRIKYGDMRNDLAVAAYQQHWMAGSAAILVFAAIAEMTTGKYGERGIRYIHIEVGHSAQNVFLQAQSLGLAAAVIGAFDDDEAGRILDLRAGEQVLYMMPVGR